MSELVHLPFFTILSNPTVSNYSTVVFIWIVYEQFLEAILMREGPNSKKKSNQTAHFKLSENDWIIAYFINSFQSELWLVDKFFANSFIRAWGISLDFFIRRGTLWRGTPSLCRDTRKPQKNYPNTTERALKKFLIMNLFFIKFMAAIWTLSDQTIENVTYLSL